MRIIFHDSNFDIFTFFCVYLYFNFNHKSLKKEFIYNFMKTNSKNIFKSSTNPGDLVYTGTDKYNNKIYILNRKKYKKIVCQALKGMFNIFKSYNSNLNQDITLFNIDTYRNPYFYLGSLTKYMNIPQYLQNKIYYKAISSEYSNLKKDLKKLHLSLKEENSY